jgi:hypothetical protein
MIAHDGVTMRTARDMKVKELIQDDVGEDIDDE